MDFRIADTFTASMARLTNDEQKLVKMTAFDLQMNPSSPGMQFHKLDRAKDKSFWSVRVGRDIRLIVHKTAAGLLLCYVGHHDDAYDWAERRKIERHPTTGAAQLVEIRERVQDVVIPNYVEASKVKSAGRPLFQKLDDEKLVSFGLPAEWLSDVRKIVSEDELLALIEHLPAEAAEALIDLAAGHEPRVPEPVATTNPFEHPAAEQRFRLMTDVDELSRALNAPWDRWAVFLHPDQQSLVRKQFNGPARVAGSAGTGKTVVALHRAVQLAKSNGNARVLLTTFSEPLAKMLQRRLAVLAGDNPSLLAQIKIASFDDVGYSRFADRLGKQPRIADEAKIRSMLRIAVAEKAGSRFTESFLWSEWRDVVDAWQLRSWEAYRDVARIGRRTRLAEKQRQMAWQIFAEVQTAIGQQGLTTAAEVFNQLSSDTGGRVSKQFDFVVIDEAQDLSVSQLRFLAAFWGKKPNGLMFCGDLGQRIFQAPFSWKSIGIDLRGRSHTLRINYRTSHQIRKQADRLLPGSVSDVDGVSDDRSRTLSVINGPVPEINLAKDFADEQRFVSKWLHDLQQEAVPPHEIAIFVRSDDQIERARSAAISAGLAVCLLAAATGDSRDCVSIGTMHDAKGLEFRAVAVIACDEDLIPKSDRIEAAADESELAEIHESERQLLYVACTRARDHLLITGVVPASEFLSDLSIAPRAFR